MYKISIVTPCYNASKFISETVRSVLNQSAVLNNRCELEYIICDGSSTDDTLEKINTYCYHPQFKAVKILSEPDEGMYGALAKGLQLCTGNIIAYINSDDFYNEHAFSIVLNVFENCNAKWLTGYNTFCNERSEVVRLNLPYKYRRQFFECGYYGSSLPFVQQESTFWDVSLNNLIDFCYLSKMKYAGDFYIWQQFSKKHELKIVEGYLGGFRFRKGQLSENKKAYLEEMQTITRKPNSIDKALLVWDKILWHAPSRLKKEFNKDSLIRFDQKLQEWV